jgi:hypothetical protein
MLECNACSLRSYYSHSTPPHLGHQRCLLELVLLQQEVHERRCHVAVPQQVLKSEHIWGEATRTQGPMAIAIASSSSRIISRGTPLLPVAHQLLLAQFLLLHLCLLHPTLSAKHQSHRDDIITAAVVGNSVRIWACKVVARVTPLGLRCIFVLLALLERLAIDQPHNNRLTTWNGMAYIRPDTRRGAHSPAL